MGLKDLKPSTAFDAITREIENEPGLNQAQRDAVVATLQKATADITSAAEKAEKGLKVARFVTSVMKDPKNILSLMGIW